MKGLEASRRFTLKRGDAGKGQEGARWSDDARLHQVMQARDKSAPSHVPYCLLRAFVTCPTVSLRACVMCRTRLTVCSRACVVVQRDLAGLDLC